MRKRYCTLPKDPFGFREWFEKKFGDLCKTHDEEYFIGYRQGGCKLCSDLKFVLGIANRGYCLLAMATLFAVQMPWLWWKWCVNSTRKK